MHKRHGRWSLLLAKSQLKLALALSLLSMLGFSSCSIFDRPEESPAYLKFEDPGVVLDENTGFVSRLGLKDVWVYAGGNLQGTYPVLPVTANNWTTIPYLIPDNPSFFLEGGIHESGQSAFHLPYPFWDRVEFTVSQEPGDTFVVQPLFHYVDASQRKVEFSETFENGVFNLVPFNTALSNSDSTGFRRRQSGAFMGDFSGYVPFGADDRWFEVLNANSFSAARDKDIYAEITYRTSVNLGVGLVFLEPTGSLGSEPIITLTPTAEWNTVYIHLIGQVRNIINLYGESTQFWLWMKVDGNGNDGYLWLDNVSVIQED